MKYLKHKNLLIFLLIVFLPTLSFSQGLPIFNQQVFFPQTFNPSRYGDGFFMVNYRRQWLELQSREAPATLNFNADLSEILDLRSKKIALGFGILSDKVHLIDNFDGRISFAYHLIDTDKTRVRLGLNAGALSQQIRIDQNTRIDEIPLSFESSTGLVATAGPGFFYQGTSTNDNVFEFDASLPRLFFSGIGDSSNFSTVNMPNLLLRTAYTMRFGSSTFAPVVFYRNSFSGSKSNFNNMGQLDFALRGGFLDEQFWVGLGTRFHLGETEGAKPFSLPLQCTFGASVFSQGTVVGSFDLNSALGTSFEFGFIYSFKENEAGLSRSKARSEIQGIANEINLKSDELSKILGEKINLTEKLKIEIGTLERSTETSEAKRARIKKFENDLNTVKKWVETDLNNSLVQFSEYNAKCDSYIENKLIPANSPSVNTIRYALKDIENKQEGIKTNIQNSLDSLAALKRRLPMDLSGILASKQINYRQLDTFLNVALSKLSKKPRGMERIKVLNVGKGFSITYQFSNALDKYYVESDTLLADVKNLLDFSSKMIAEFTKSNFRPDSITYTVLTRDEESLASSILRGIYNGEYGSTVKINFTSRNSAENTAKVLGREIVLKSGDKTNFVQFALLKVFSLKRFMDNKIKFDPNRSVIELISPNKDLNSSQQFRISILYTNK